jgi:hypothetical protein
VNPPVDLPLTNRTSPEAVGTYFPHFMMRWVQARPNRVLTKSLRFCTSIVAAVP